VEVPGIATTNRNIRFQLAAKEFVEAGLLPQGRSLQHRLA
jgi:hypothetical protein